MSEMASDKNRSIDLWSNCLSLVRIVAAIQVMFGHMTEHLGLPIDNSLLRISYFLRGVPIFFGLSGYLIWFSIGRSSSYGQYIIKRFWRIYPELWIAVIIEIVPILFFCEDKLNLRDMLLFILGQGTLFQFWTPDSLRWYGVGVPNGALWTIGVMVQFYAVAWFFFKVMKDRDIKAWVIGFAVSFGLSLAMNIVAHDLVNSAILSKLYDQTIIKYFWLFYIGMFIAEYANKLIPNLMRYWPAFIMIAFGFYWTKLDIISGYFLGWSVFLVGGAIGFAYCFPRLSVRRDISYGLFLYHMIVVNVFVQLKLLGNWACAALASLIAIIFAYASTVTVGKLSSYRKNTFLSKDGTERP